jgi:hypothetical protein
MDREESIGDNRAYRKIGKRPPSPPPDTRGVLVAKIAARIFVTQTAQIKFWEADKCDLDRVLKMSLELAQDLVQSVDGL